MNKKRKRAFFAFMAERHSIYLKRHGGEPAPWTKDPILQTHKFCNVFRELDRTTIWIDAAIRLPYQKHPQLPHMLALARIINYPPTLKHLQSEGVWWPHGKYRQQQLTQCLDHYHRTGHKVFGNAYMITGTGVPHGWSKARNIADNLFLSVLQDKRLTDAAKTNKGGTLEGFSHALSRHKGWGPFLAYEVACDLRHCRGWLNGASDRLTWANPGPGAKRGLNRLYERALKHRQPLAEFNHEMRLLLQEARVFLPAWFPCAMLEMREIEHTLCEFDKWERGGGKARYPQKRGGW